MRFSLIFGLCLVFLSACEDGHECSDGASCVDAGACPRESLGDYGATRVSLEDFTRNGVPATLVAQDARYACTTPATQGQAPDGTLATRTEGCGRVKITSGVVSWNRTSIYDASTGALIGAYQLDDIATQLPGVTCVDVAYVAGIALAEPTCEDNESFYCTAASE